MRWPLPMLHSPLAHTVISSPDKVCISKQGSSQQAPLPAQLPHQISMQIQRVLAVAVAAHVPSTVLPSRVSHEQQTNTAPRPALGTGSGLVSRQMT